MSAQIQTIRYAPFTGAPIVVKSNASTVNFPADASSHTLDLFKIIGQVNIVGIRALNKTLTGTADFGLGNGSFSVRVGAGVSPIGTGAAFTTLLNTPKHTLIQTSATISSRMITIATAGAGSSKYEGVATSSTPGQDAQRGTGWTKYFSQAWDGTFTNLVDTFICLQGTLQNSAWVGTYDFYVEYTPITPGSSIISV